MNVRMTAAAVALLCAWPLAAAAQSSPYKTDVCPVPAGVRGYTIVVRPEAGTGADSTYLRKIADIVGGHIGAIPRDSTWAAVRATVRADGRLREAALAAPSGDRGFDRRLLQGVRAAFQDGDLPAPAGLTADSLVVRLLFGEQPAAGETTFRRFSAQSRLPELRTGRGGRVEWPADLPLTVLTGSAVVWVSFDKAGTASVSDRHPVRASDHRLEAAVRQLVPRLAFVPGQSNCEPQGYIMPVRIQFQGGSQVRVQILGR